MKITKTYLKQVILEEIQKMEEANSTTAMMATTSTTAPNPEEIKKQKEQDQMLLKSLMADLASAKASRDRIDLLTKQINDLRAKMSER